MREWFFCNGPVNYKNAFNKLFYRVAILQFGAPIACRKYGLEHDNTVERYNGKISDRIRYIRSEFKNFSDADNFMKLKRIIHYFVNPNQELDGKIPAETADIKIPFGRNKLLDLIKHVKDNYVLLSWQYIIFK